MKITKFFCSLNRNLKRKREFKRMQALHANRPFDYGLPQPALGEKVDPKQQHARNIAALRVAIAREKRLWDRINLTFEEQTHQRQKPLRFFKLQSELMKYIGGTTMVEIGSARAKLLHPITDFNPVCCNDGHSSYHWASNMSFNVHTVDISSESKINLDQAAHSNLQAYTGDGIDFLRDWSGPSIDFLFLDAWDVGTPLYAEKHLEAFVTIKDRLSARHIIGIDDTDFSGDGKGKLLVPHLKSNGYTIVVDGRQTVFVNFLME